jgi:hypothetical protein
MKKPCARNGSTGALKSTHTHASTSGRAEDLRKPPVLPVLIPVHLCARDARRCFATFTICPARNCDPYRARAPGRGADNNAGAQRPYVLV